MPRRYTINVRCTFPDCGERSFYEAETRADEQRIRRDYVPNWKCVRHTKPDEVLAAGAPERTTTLVCREIAFDAGRPLGKFWVSEARSDEQPAGLLIGSAGGNGFTFGPGFKAYAKDFPTGTRLVITATVQIPTPTARED